MHLAYPSCIGLTRDSITQLTLTPAKEKKKLSRRRRGPSSAVSGEQWDLPITSWQKPWDVNWKLLSHDSSLDEIQGGTHLATTSLRSTLWYFHMYPPFSPNIATNTFCWLYPLCAIGLFVFFPARFAEAHFSGDKILHDGSFCAV